MSEPAADLAAAALAAVVALAAHEATIERGLATFIEVGEALAAIRDERLYRESHATFEDYCRERWGFSRQRAHQMIDAATLSSTVVDAGLPAPANEAQARALAAVPDTERPTVWREVLDAGRPTAAAVRATATRLADRYEQVERARAQQAEQRADDEAFWTDVAATAVETGAAQRIADERPYGLAAVVIARTTRELAELLTQHDPRELAQRIPTHSRNSLTAIPDVVRDLTTLWEALP